ncbi:riboflavin synthase subunit alpha [Citricoccus zhacaiensis]|uniref:Riboflavin synthase n=1 Tax=Citricoccus zhacaiensis TaxID=489142 RepID=A0ABQ2M7A1_9MICC|nr:riboflavin synthase [Citricoccus zhacaiensis]GGO47848.1 riboflavin synthase subunit alpha [Citricoccus zhacaiensis]
MFTGIITELGTITELEHRPDQDSARLTIQAPSSSVDLPFGGSLAVNGTCLTATAVSTGSVVVDVIGETLRRTSIGDLRPGDRVNLERCMPASGRFDGHIVQGHVDGTGTIAKIEVHGSWRQVRIALPAGLGRYVAEKGSIAVDGVSLTVTAVNDVSSRSESEALSEPPTEALAGAPNDWFEIGLIPATLAETTLGTRSLGDRVNLEVDVVVKYAARLTDHDRASASATAGQEVTR